MEAEAKHEFNPTEAGELPLRKGDLICISNYGDKVSWYNAHRGTESGIVPGNYIELKKESWYMGRISRSVAEEIVSGQPEGFFVVRLSESSPENFSLSVKCTDTVQHFRILKDQENSYFLWSDRFPSINKLVEHYKSESVSRCSKIVLRDMDGFLAEALYDFEPSQSKGDETELGFRKGQLVLVVDTRDDHWWGGRIDEQTGFFPKTYVKRICNLFDSGDPPDEYRG